MGNVCPKCAKCKCGNIREEVIVVDDLLVAERLSRMQAQIVYRSKYTSIEKDIGAGLKLRQSASALLFPRFYDNIEPIRKDKTDKLAATSLLERQAVSVRAYTICWRTYLKSETITLNDYAFIIQYDRPYQSDKQQEEMLNDNKVECVRMFLHLLDKIPDDHVLEYSLVLIHDMLQDNKKNAEIFHIYAITDGEILVWKPFLKLLVHEDLFVANMSLMLVAEIASWSRYRMEGPPLLEYVITLLEQLEIKENRYIHTALRSLQTILKVEVYRNIFVTVDGVTSLVTFLSKNSNNQIQYQVIFCLWELTQSPHIAESIDKFRVISTLANILNTAVKEKVIRVILAVYRNLIIKPKDKKAVQSNSVTMIQYKVLKNLNRIQDQRLNDEDAMEDAAFLSKRLETVIQNMSSFDAYALEVRSGKLEWSPVHKPKFFRENAHRMKEKNYELLRILINTLDLSEDPIVQSIAIYDIGEYARHVPNGKKTVDRLRGKTLIMSMLTHENASVRYEALIAVQKLMIYNWEYLGEDDEYDEAAKTHAMEHPAAGRTKL